MKLDEGHQPQNLYANDLIITNKKKDHLRIRLKPEIFLRPSAAISEATSSATKQVTSYVLCLPLIDLDNVLCVIPQNDADDA